MEVEQDNTYDSVDDAKKHAEEKNRSVLWSDGIKHITFDDVDFQNGKVNYIERFGEDMLEIKYSYGYMIDIGYYENLQVFEITIVKNDDWVNVLKEVEAKTDIELKRKIMDEIQWTKSQEK